jgi:hypothetical protein
MHRKFLLGVSLAMLVGLFALPAVASADHSGDHMGITKSRVLTATLTGDAEVPPVDVDGTGLIRVTIDRAKHLFCYELVASDITIVAGHIHEAAAGSNGAVVVDLNPIGQALDETSSGCTLEVGKGILRRIKTNPEGFYVNLHTADNPGGEIRGQLARR